MTSRDWQADRRAVFDRDDHTCRHCGTTGDATDPTALRTVPVGAVPLEGTVHESALVTVCTDCFETLQTESNDAPPGTPLSRAELFEHVREMTRTQGGAISDVASFASLATSVPSTLVEDSTAEVDDGSEPAADADSEPDIDETAAEYRHARRDVLLAIDVADVHLERLAAVDDEALEADVRSSLVTVSETAIRLQSALRTVVELGETVAVGVGHCHGCFEPLEDGSCSTCGLEARETAEWQRADGGLAFERLFSSINDGLQEASATTETLTDRTMTLAEGLTDD